MTAAVPERVVEYMDPVQSMGFAELRTAIQACRWDHDHHPAGIEALRDEMLRRTAAARRERARPARRTHVAGAAVPASRGPLVQRVTAWGDGELMPAGEADYWHFCPASPGTSCDLCGRVNP